MLSRKKVPLDELVDPVWLLKTTARDFYFLKIKSSRQFPVPACVFTNPVHFPKNERGPVVFH